MLQIVVCDRSARISGDRVVGETIQVGQESWGWMLEWKVGKAVMVSDETWKDHSRAVRELVAAVTRVEKGEVDAVYADKEDCSMQMKLF